MIDFSATAKGLLDGVALGLIAFALITPEKYADFPANVRFILVAGALLVLWMHR